MMQCPSDGQTLAMTTREGIEIDYCPTCRGVWLDRGELDKLIERSAALAAPARDQSARRDTPVVPYDEPSAPRGYRRYDDDDDDDRRRATGGYGDHGHYGKRKRRSFLDDIFDFG